MTTFRGFIAIDIEKHPQIASFITSIQKTQADVKLVKPENIHITLKFLGDVHEELVSEIESVMKEACKNSKPFIINLSGTGVFPNQQYIKVIWIGIQDTTFIEPIATSINENLAQCGFKKDHRPFSPHITIGRVRTARNKQELLSIIQQYQHMEFGKQEVTSIKFMKSVLTPKGPIYSIVKELSF